MLIKKRNFDRAALSILTNSVTPATSTRNTRTRHAIRAIGMFANESIMTTVPVMMITRIYRENIMARARARGHNGTQRVIYVFAVIVREHRGDFGKRV